MNEPKDEEGGSHKGPPHLPAIKDPATSDKVGKPASKRPVRSNPKKSSEVVPKSRTRAKSTSDKGYVAPLEKGICSESEIIVADSREEDAKETIMPVDVVEDQNLECNSEIEETLVTVYEEKAGELCE